VRSTETHPPWPDLHPASVDFDHRPDPRKGWAVSLERRWSSRRFPYGYLVTTSSQSPASP